jgi:gliding motility-associated-like protein
MFMRLHRVVALLGYLFISCATVNAQSFSFNCTRDTMVPACPAILCITLKGKIPDLHKLSTSYTISPTSSTPGCFPIYVQPNDPAGTPTNLSVDDTYTGVINLGFNFPFFGSVYPSLIASTNGYVSFDISKAGLYAHWSISADLPSTSYDKAMIMGPYHDLNPNVTQPTQRCQYQVFGTAPHRRWILSFYKVPLFGSSCGGLIENTHQIVLYESTGIVEVIIFSKQTCTAWNSGRAIVGMQDFARTSGIMAPGRTATGPTWGSVNMNESWRFIPKDGASLLKRVELYDASGTLVSTGTTAAAGVGELEASFTNVCAPAGATTTYVIKSVYEKFDDPTVEIFGTDTVRVNRAAGLAGTATTVPASCGNNNGTITVGNVSGGTMPYEYSLDGVNFQSSNVFTGLAIGNYIVTIRDASTLCVKTINVTVASTGNLATTITPTATSCSTVSNGSIVISSAAGSGPYTFKLDTGTPVSGTIPFTFTNVAAGAHTVLVTDLGINCNSGPVSVTVAVGPGVSASATTTATTCSGASNGTLVVNATAGIAPFTYQLDGGTFMSGNNPYTFSNLTSGTHTIVVKDNVGCQISTTATVTAGPVLATTAAATNVLCSGGSTGTITVTQPTMGIPPYSYSIDNGTTWQTSNTFNGLIAGTYTVKFREGNGCVGSTTVIVTEPAPMDATATTVPVVCNGQSNGIITVSAIGGTIPYQYSADAGATWQANNVFNVAAGVYTVVVKDANGCTKNISVTITQPAALTAAVTTTNATCNGGNDGVITIVATGGNGTNQYSIDGGTTWQAATTYNVAPGAYVVMVKDNLGCSATYNVTVNLTNDLTFTPQLDATICESKSVQLALVSNGLQYSWTPATALSATNIYNPIANPVVTTQYIATVTYGRCSAKDTVIVNVNAAPIPDAGDSIFLCFGQSATLQPRGGVRYSWTPTTFLNNPLLTNPVSTPLNNITYTLSILADANGCGSLVTDSVHIDVTPPIQLFSYPADTIGYPGDQFQIRAVSPDPDVTFFNWTPRVGLSSYTIPDPIVTIGVIGSDVRYKVEGSTIAGCKGEAYVNVRVYKGPDIYVPTGFTPNGDGKNDQFIPFPVGMKSYNYFRVYNRWGQLVFNTQKLNVGWDGTISGKMQPEGIYVWMIEGLTKDDRVITKKGTVMLIK